MRKNLAGKAFVSLLLFIFLFSCQSQKKNSKIKKESFGATPVKVFKVRRENISEKLHFTGLIQPWKKINITPDIGGKIAKIYVDEGEKVKKGQLLAELDTRAIRLQLEQTEAGLAVAGANFKDAKRNMERMERLRKEKAVSDQQYEKIRLAYEAAEAQLQQAQATLNLARHQLDVSLMKAPFSGVVASKNAEVGDVINPMMGALSPTSGVLTLMDFSQVKIDIKVSQDEIVRIRKGQIAWLSITALPNRLFKGKVTLVSLTADPLTKNFKIVVTAANPDLILRPNTFGEVTLEVSTHAHALVIPQKAVVEDRFVFIVEENKAQKREIFLGLQNEEMVEVVKGVNEGDLVIVEGNYGLEDQSEIEIKEVIE